MLLRILASCAALASLALAGQALAQTAQPRNVILLLGDGMGFAQVKAYRSYANDPETSGIDALPFDRYLTGAVATEGVAIDCPSGPASCKPDPYAVVDSAASATAYATGVDTMNGAIGVDAKGQPRESVLEIAAAQGMGTGLVATSQLTHASPASFVAKVPSRRMVNPIADHLFDRKQGGLPVTQVLLGGGMAQFKREDRDLIAEFEGAGYAVATDRDGLLAMEGDRLLGVFADQGIDRHWDRDESVPTLADMTRKALATLSRSEHGFFLMVEGSQIDWSGHGDDIVGVISEMEGFTEAVEAVLEFAANRDDTLVVMTADHETGGLSLGRDGIYRWNPQPLRGVEKTPIGMLQAFGAQFEGVDVEAGEMPESLRPLSAFVADAVPFELTEEEIAGIDGAELDERTLYFAINAVFDQRTHTGWSSEGHTGVDVPLYALGPGSERFRGVLQNQTVGQYLIDAVRR